MPLSQPKKDELTLPDGITWDDIEVLGSGGAPQPQKSGELSLPPGITWDDVASFDKPKEEPGYAKVVGKGLVRGVEGLAGGIGSVLRWAGEATGDKLAARIGKETSEYWRKAATEGRFAPDPTVFRGTFMDAPSFKRAVGIVSEALPSLGAALITGGAGVAAGLSRVAAGWLAGSALGLLEGAPQYEEAREAGKSIGEASLVGAASTAGTAILESLAVGKFLRLGRQAERVGKKAGQIAGRFPAIAGAGTGLVVEGMQEGSQQLWQNLVAKMGYDDTQELAEGLIEAMIGGAGAGGIAGGTMAKLNRIAEKAKDQGLTDQEVSTAVDDLKGQIEDAAHGEIAQLTQTPPEQWQALKDTQGPNAVASTIFNQVGALDDTLQLRSVRQALADPETSISKRLEAINKVKHVLEGMDMNLAKTWTDNAYLSAYNNLPIAINQNLATTDIDDTAQAPVSPVEQTISKAFKVLDRKFGTRSGAEVETLAEGIATTEPLKPSQTVEGRPTPYMGPYGLVESTEGTPSEPVRPSREVEPTPTPDMGPTALQRLRGAMYGKKGRYVEGGEDIARAKGASTESGDYAKQEPQVFRGKNVDTMVHPSAKRPGVWQVTSFDKKETPLSDEEFKDYEEAVNAARRDAGISTKEEDEALKELEATLTPEFDIGETPTDKEPLTVGTKIDAAAIRMKDGTLYTGQTHTQAFDDIPMDKRKDIDDADGFVDDQGNFMGRDEVLEKARTWSGGKLTDADATMLVGQNLESDIGEQEPVGEPASLMGATGTIEGATPIKNPSGRWTFAGKVPMELSFQRIDGNPLTDEDVANIKRHGPGLFKNTIKTVSFASKEEALAAAERVAKGEAHTAKGGEAKAQDIVYFAESNVDELGNWTMPGDTLKKYLKNKSDEDIVSLMQWAKNQSAHVNRNVTGEAAAALRERNVPVDTIKWQQDNLPEPPAPVPTPQDTGGSPPPIVGPPPADQEGYGEGVGVKPIQKAGAAVEAAKATKPASIGTAWVKNQWRPITESREITRGKNKGKFRVALADGKRKVVDTVKLAEAPATVVQDSKEIFIQKAPKTDKGGTARSRRLAKLNESAPEGYETVYKPYGEQGRGYYYVPKTEPKGKEPSKPEPLTREQKLSKIAQEGEAKNREKANKAKSFRMWLKWAGGIQRKDKTWAGEIRDIVGRRGMKGMPPGIFKRDALGIDEMTEKAIEAGWLPSGATEDDFIRALEENPREKVSALGTEEWIDKQYEKELESIKQRTLDEGESEDDIARSERDGIQTANAEAAEKAAGRNPVDETGFNWSTGEWEGEPPTEVKEQGTLFGRHEERPFELTPEDLTDKEKLARAQDEAKRKGIQPKRQKPVFQHDKGIKPPIAGKQQSLFGPGAEQQEIFTNARGEIEPKFKPVPPPPHFVRTRQRTRMVWTGGTIKSASWTVRDRSDVAALLSKFRKHKQENLFVVSTDKNDRIIEVFLYSKGSKSSSVYKPSEIAGHILNMPDATKVYLVHNHPSGQAKSSKEDKLLVRAVTKEADMRETPVDIEALVIAGTKWVAFNDRVDIGNPQKIKASLRKTEIPVKEGLIVKKKDYASAANITDSDVARHVINTEYDGKEGFLLLDQSGRDIGFLEFVPGRPMRETTRDLISVFEKANVSSVIFNSKKEITPSDDRSKFIRDLIRELEHDVMVMEILSPKLSFRDQGIYERPESNGELSLFGDRINITPAVVGRHVYTGSEQVMYSMRERNAYRQAQIPTTATLGISADRLNRLAYAINRRWKNAPPITVVDKQADLPDTLRAQQEGKIISGAYHNGQVYLVAENMVSPSFARKTIAHEVIGHHGFKVLREVPETKDRMDKFLGRLYRTEKDAIDLIAQRYGYDTGTPEGTLLASEEWLARQAETNPRDTWVRRAVAMIRHWLSRTFPGLKVNNSEIAAWIGQMRKSVVEGKSDIGEMSAEEARLQTVYHGTPHVWIPEPGFPHGRPRLDKIGTGEGSQAYGWGWYSAAEEGTAGKYKPNSNAPFSRPMERYALMLNGEVVDLSQFDNQLDKEILGEVANDTMGIGQAINALADFNPKSKALKFLKENRTNLEVVPYDPSSLYTLDIPDEIMPKLLDWDNVPPVGMINKMKLQAAKDWSDDLQKRFNERIEKQELADRGLLKKAVSEGRYKGLTGQRYYNIISQLLGSDKQASEFLARAGIPGNTHGGVSKGATGAKYVIWDQAVLDKIALLERNGEKLDAIREAEIARYSLTEGKEPATPTPMTEKGEGRIPTVSQKAEGGTPNIKADGEVVPTQVIELHQVEDTDKFNRLVDLMEKDGWQGPPILVVDNGNGTFAFTGSHRIASARKSDIDIPVKYLDFDAVEEWAQENDTTIDDLLGGRDEDRLAALEVIGDKDAIALMRYEIEKDPFEKPRSPSIGEQPRYSSKTPDEYAREFLKAYIEAQPAAKREAVQKTIQKEQKAADKALQKDHITLWDTLKKIPKISRTGWKEGKPDFKSWQRLLSVPSHFFHEIESMGRVFNAGLENQDNRNRLKDDILKADDGTYHTQNLDLLRKQDKGQYAKLTKYIKHRDQNGIGYRILKNDDTGVWELYSPKNKETPVATFEKESEAVDAMIRAEGADYLKAGGTEQAANALMGFRRATNNGFDLLFQAMRDLIWHYQETGQELPSETVNIDGKAVNVNLRMALAKMGDMRGYYFPRIRKPGRYVGYARKKGAHPVRQHFDAKTMLAAWQVKMESRGYTVTKDTQKRMPEDVFEMAGQVVAQEAIINEALNRIRTKKYTLEDFGLRGVDRKLGPGKRDFMVKGPTSKEVNALFKKMGGRFFPSDPGSPRVWHFENPGAHFESRLAKAIAFEKAALDVDLNTQAMFAKALVEQVANVIKGRGSRQHMIARRDAKGLEVWEGYEEDPAMALAKYGQSVAAGEAKKIMAKDMLAAFTGTDISWRQFKEMEGEEATYENYLEFVENRRVDPVNQPNAYKEGKSYIEHMLRNDEAIDRFTGTIKGIAVMKYLAGRVSAPLVNLTALATSVPASMNGFGNIPLHRSFDYLAKASRYYGTYAFGDKNSLPRDIRRLFDEIHENGWHNAQYNREALAVLKSKAGRGWDRMIDWGMIGFGVTEKLNRVSTIAGAYLGLKDQGQTDHDAMLSLAKRISDQSHATYGKANWPLIARGTHPAAHVMKAFYVFRTFSHNYLLTMKDLWGPKWTPEHAKAFTYMAVSPAILAGAGGMVGWELIMSAIAQAFGLDDPEEDMYAWLDANIGESAERFARFGAFGLIGMNLKGSLEIGVTDLPTNFKDLLGAPGSVIGDIYEGGKSILKGDVSKGIEKIAPLAIAGPIKAYRESTEGLTTRTNAPIFYGNKQAKADMSEAILRALSFNPAGIAKVREQKWAERQQEQKYSDMRIGIYSRVKKFMLQPIRERDRADWMDILEDIREYNERVKRMGLAGIVPFITDKSVRINLKRSFRPTKKEIRRRMAVNE